MYTNVVKCKQKNKYKLIMIEHKDK